MQDFLGRTLLVDDEIVYCTRTGSHMELVRARVIKAEETFIKAQPLNQGHRRPVLYRDTRTGERIFDIYSREDAWEFPGHYKKHCQGYDCKRGNDIESEWSYHRGKHRPWVEEYRGDVREVQLRHPEYIVIVRPFG